MNDVVFERAFNKRCLGSDWPNVDVIGRHLACKIKIHLTELYKITYYSPYGLLKKKKTFSNTALSVF